VTPEEEALAKVVRSLEALSIAYMVTGSVASSHHGRPRMTHDVDIVIDPSPEGLARLVGELVSSGFYVDAGRARDAMWLRRQFNAIEMQTAVKIDLIVRKDRPFSLEELRRRQPADLPGGMRVTLATPEDTILSKLEWARKGGGSEKQLADVAGVLDVHAGVLDRAYIDRWARELGVLDLWQRVAKPG
jgi:acetolactate synthase regulatory subunit